MNDRPVKSFKWIGAIAAVTIFGALQLVSQSLIIGQPTSYNLDSSRRLFLDTDENTKVWEQSWQLEQEMEHSPKPAQSESQLSLLSSQKIEVQPRAFDTWPVNRPLPCFPPDGVMIENGPHFGGRELAYRTECGPSPES
eukprot:scaffold2509_cov169-Amphora_coffeaeformis.AAC.16